MPHDSLPFSRSPGLVARSGSVLLFSLMTTPAVATANCFAAADAMSAGRWAEAIPLLEARIADPTCREQIGSLRYSLAYANEKLADAEPARACAAADHYAAVEIDDAAIAAASMAGRERMEEACRLGRAGEPGGGASPGLAAKAPIPPEIDRTAAVTLSVGAGLAAVAGGTLLYFGVQADDQRADAEAVMRAAHAVGDTERQDRAESDFRDAADRATAFGLSGWGMLALAAGLGIAATWTWVDDGPTVTVGGGQVGVSGRF